MKLVKIFALAIGALALFPAVSFAQTNINGTSQDATLKSATVGCGNTTVQSTKQGAASLQNAAFPGTNINGTAQKVNADAVTIGQGNVSVQQSVQDALNAQKAK